MSIAVGSTGDNANSEVKDTVVGLAFIRASGDFWCHTLELHLQKNMGKFNFCCPFCYSLHKWRSSVLNAGITLKAGQKTVD